MSMTLRFDWVTDDAGLDALRVPWAPLVVEDSPGTPFKTWDWQASWWKTLGRRRDRELRILVARDGEGAVRAILPMYLERGSVAGIVPRRRLRFLGDTPVGSDYLGLVASRPDAAALGPAIARHLATDPMARAADLVELDDLREGDGFANELVEAFEAAGYVDVELPRRYVCPIAEWGGDLDTYLAERPNKFGSQIRRRRAELAKKAGFRLEVRSKPDDVAAGLEDLFALHRRRWAEEGGSEAITDASVETFHRRAGRLLAERGMARVAVLHLEGKPAAAGYGFVHGRRFSYYQAGLAPEWRRRSAGMVVLVELMRHVAQLGIGELDFLRGDEPYKQIWATGARATCAVRARRATRAAWGAARALRALAALRAGLKSVIPDPALVALRKLRNRLQQGAHS